LEEVRNFAVEISSFLLESGAKLIVVACNAASAAALRYLRERFPEIDFVGMEPAVKPAAENSESRVVAVLATPATFQGALYASVVERFASGVQLLQDNCPGLVETIESGDLDGPRVRQILEKALKPMLKRGADTVVLGCTHYPFVIPLIKEISGPEVRVIDPAPAVARQVRRVLESRGLLRDQTLQGPPESIFHTTGDAENFSASLKQFLNMDYPISHLDWIDGKLEKHPGSHSLSLVD
jgi:glutamate racemase